MSAVTYVGLSSTTLTISSLFTLLHHAQSIHLFLSFVPYGARPSPLSSVSGSIQYCSSPSNMTPHTARDAIHLQERNRPKCGYCKKRGHKLPICPTITCFRCGRRGHIARTCPNEVRCERCFKTTHITERCPYNTPEYADVTFIPVPSNPRNCMAVGEPPDTNQMATSLEAEEVSGKQ